MGTTNDLPNCNTPITDPVELIVAEGFTRDGLSALTALITSGERKIRLNNREIEFQSILQMMKLRDRMKRELDAEDIRTGVKPRHPRVLRARLSSGL